MAYIIKTTGEVIETQPANGTDFSLEELQTIVGGYIEVVSLHDGRLIVCDEQGKQKSKDINHTATDLFRLTLLTNDFLVGDILVCREEQIK